MEFLGAIFFLAVLASSAALYYVSEKSHQRERDQILMRRLGCTLDVPAGGAARAPGGPLESIGRALERIPRYGVRLSGALRNDGKITVAAPLLFVAGVALFARWFGLGGAILLGAGLSAIPVSYRRWRRRRWLASFSEQLPYLIDVLRSALESGHTLLRALQMAAQNLPQPVSGEVRRIVEQVQLGMSVPHALEGMLRRAPVEELGFLVAAVRIQTDVGSSLAEILSHVSASVRNRQRAEQQLRALTAQSRASAAVVTCLPLIVLAAFSLINPHYAHPLFYSKLGHKLLELAIVLDVLAFGLMRRIAQVDY